MTANNRKETKANVNPEKDASGFYENYGLTRFTTFNGTAGILETTHKTLCVNVCVAMLKYKQVPRQSALFLEYK